MDAGAQLTEHEERHEFDNEVERLLTQLPPPAPSHPYRQILLADDGSPGARAALERVAAITTSETTVTVITVIPFESVGASPDPIKPELRDWQWHSLRPQPSSSSAASGRSSKPAAGNSAPVISEVAQTLKADLVILGRGHDERWHPPLKRRSVRRVLLRTLACDALVVSP